MHRYYKILELEFPATRDEVKKAFYRLAHIHHPDKGGDAEGFKEISEAYHVLVQRGYWDVLAKEKSKGTPMTRKDSSKFNIHFNDDGTEFWMEDELSFVKYYWTGKNDTIDPMYWRDDKSSSSKDYVELTPTLLKDAVMPRLR